VSAWRESGVTRLASFADCEDRSTKMAQMTQIDRAGSRVLI
jgi:hypothetical protein